MTSWQTLLFEFVTHGVLILLFAILWLVERRGRRSAERRELTEFELRTETVLSTSTEVGTLRTRVKELEKALRSDPYSSRNAAPAPEPRRPDGVTHPKGDYRRTATGRPLPPSNPPPPAPTLRED